MTPDITWPAERSAFFVDKLPNQAVLTTNLSYSDLIINELMREILGTPALIQDFACPPKQTKDVFTINGLFNVKKSLNLPFSLDAAALAFPCFSSLLGQGWPFLLILLLSLRARPAILFLLPLFG